MWRAPLGVAVAVSCAAAITAGVAIASFGGNPTALAHATTVQVRSAPPGLYLRDPSKNYDGVFFYRLSRNPFTSRDVEHGVHLDAPAYRQQRILYPVLAWALAGGGRGSLVGWSLVAVNVVAFGVLAWAAASLCVRYGRSPWWGAGIGLFPGLAISLLYDLSEVVSTALVALACLAIVRQRRGWAAVALSAAVLARETTAVLAVAVALPVALTTIRGRPRPTVRSVACAAAPFGVLAGWQLALWANWSTLAATDGRLNFGFPFAGIASALAHAADGLDGFASAGLALAMIALVTIAATVASRSTAPNELKLAGLLYAAVAVLFSEEIWGSYQASMRVLADVGLLSVLLIAAAPRASWQRLVPLANVTGFGAVAMIDLVFLR